jgi:hypothetical protein
MRTSVELFEHETVRVGDALRVRRGGPRDLKEADHAALARFNDAHEGRFFRLGHRSITAVVNHIPAENCGHAASA